MSDVQVQIAVPLKEVRALCRAKYGADWWKHPDKNKRKKEASAALSTSYLPAAPAPTSTAPAPSIDVLLAKIASLESKVKEQAAIIEEDYIPNGLYTDP